MKELPQIITVIQARKGSTRLPGKILMPLAGKPLLIRMVERVIAAKLSGTVVVATTANPEDDVVEDLCLKEGFNIFRGNALDLLDRHYHAAIEYNADAVVKIPSDVPLIDPLIIDKVLGFYIEHHNEYDFVSNLHPATYPDGNDVEVFSIKALEEAWRNAGRQMEREHTTPYFWENPDKFRIANIEWETGLDYSMSHRFTIDYMEDYLFIKRVYDELHYKNPLFALDDILKLLKDKPEIYTINKKYAGVNWYRDHLGELRTVSLEQTKII